jgi:2-hydroxy-3-keto-5-methylthiopentenyl-1-phosphate phosphatase
MLVDLATASVFLDFDGTISVDDVADHVVERLAGPGWEPIQAAAEAEEIGSREWVVSIWDLLPRDETALRAAAAEIPIDRDFEPLVRELRAGGAEITVVSDGFGYYVDAVCAPLGLRVLTNRPDWDTGRIEFPHEDRCCACSSCGVCKQAPIKDAKHAGKTTVLIGDGLSDFKAALVADLVIAKGALARWCEIQGIPHARFECLGDVRHLLAGR